MLMLNTRFHSLETSRRESSGEVPCIDCSVVGFCTYPWRRFSVVLVDASYSLLGGTELGRRWQRCMVVYDRRIGVMRRGGRFREVAGRCLAGSNDLPWLGAAQRWRHCWERERERERDRQRQRQRDRERERQREEYEEEEEEEKQEGGITFKLFWDSLTGRVQIFIESDAIYGYVQNSSPIPSRG